MAGKQEGDRLTRQIHSGIGFGVDRRCVNVQDVVSGVLPLHDVQNLEYACSEGMQGERQGKEAHLLQNTSSEAQHVERGEDVPDGTIEFVANERGGIVEVFVIFDSKQHKE